MVAVTDYSALLAGPTWNGMNAAGRPIVLTYSFATTPAYYAETEQPGWLRRFDLMTDTEKQVARAAFQEWSSVSGVTFIEVSSIGDMHFSAINMVDSGDPKAAGRGAYPSVSFQITPTGALEPYSTEFRSSGDVYLGTDFRTHPRYNQDLKHLFIHEIGHALGLKHPHDVGYGNDKILEPDTPGSTVMSYQYTLGRIGFLDEAAIQHLYGPAGSKASNWTYDAAVEKFTFSSAGQSYLRGTAVADLVTASSAEQLIDTSMGNDEIRVSNASIFVKAGDGMDLVVTPLSRGDGRAVFGDTVWKTVQSGATIQRFESAEYIRFNDGVLSTKTMAWAPNATIQQFENAYNLLVGTKPSFLAIEQAATSGATSASYASGLLGTEALDSSLPATIAYAALTGKTLDTGRLPALASFVHEQVHSPGYQATANPRLGGYEAMGLGLAETAEFKTKFGTGTDAEVVRSTYQSFFGHAASEAQTQHFVGQIDYFETLYLGVGIDATSAGTKARGAAIGQMLGYAAAETGNPLFVKALDTLSGYLHADGILV